MSVRASIRELLARLRLRRREDPERDVYASEDARRRGTQPFDPSEGVQHPQNDPGAWGGF